MAHYTVFLLTVTDSTLHSQRSQRIALTKKERTMNTTLQSRREFFLQTGALSLATWTLAPLAPSRANEAPDKPSGTAATGTAATDTAKNHPADPAVAFPGVWAFDRPKRAIILVADSQLQALTDPDQEVNLSVHTEPNVTTLRKICEEAKSAGVETLVLAFDEFWKQYRSDVAGEKRALFPDSDRYIELTATISRFIADYGLGLELSLLSPLEMGKRFAETTGQAGQWVQFREGGRDGVSGRFSVSFWEHKKWGNNKGTIEPRCSGIRVFAFREQGASSSGYYPVSESEIVELTGPFETASDVANDQPLVRVTVTGTGDANSENADLSSYNRVMVLVSYETPEMDYFSKEAAPFLEKLVKKYYDAGIRLNALYSDEIHIQQDWHYFGHHDSGQFALRYFTENMAASFAQKYGEKYRAFDKYFVYFLVASHEFFSSPDAYEFAQHIPTPGDDGIQSLRLLRRRYYDLLHKTVTDLFAGAKKYAESLYGKTLEARAHATWAQSPTIDHWRSSDYGHHYEYTSDFIWSNTVHQASAACDDYFRWNDFLTGGGNDHAEGGWSDRNYYGQALACSTGSLNDTPNAYAACWGMPPEAARRHWVIEAVYGNGAFSQMKALEYGRHRAVEVLMLYPLSLVACQERFGSWMTQYGYANYVTAEKLLQYGKLTDDGAIELRGQRYRTICALYEPICEPGELEFLEEFVQAGGRVVWSGPPATVDREGEPLLDKWRGLFGIESIVSPQTGTPLPGRRVEFTGALAGIEPMTILTDFPIDAVYKIEPAADTEPLAQCDGALVGAKRGNAVYLGFRPRDDQAASLGYETRVWFETLEKLGAYPSYSPVENGPDHAVHEGEANKASNANDNPSVVSRTTPYLATRFNNGAIAVAKHYARHVETWQGGFHRDPEADRAALEQNPLDSGAIELNGLAIAGKKIDYRGEYVMAFRTNNAGQLIAFYGEQCDRIRIDGREFVFAEKPLTRCAFSPIADERRLPGGAILEIWITGDAGKVRIPVDETVCAPRLFHRKGLASFEGERPVTLTDGVLEFDSPHGASAYFLFES